MLTDFVPRLQAFAEVIVRVGLNLQARQRLLITEPYELQGVARSAEAIVDAVRTAAQEAGCPGPAAIEVIWGDGARLRAFAEKKDWRGFARLVGTNAATMQEYVRNGDALLFLQGSQPHLLDGIAPGQITELRRLGWEYFGPIAQHLMSGATNWTIIPTPSPAWANVVYADLPAEQRLASLWSDVFESCRVGPALDVPPGASPVTQALAAWQIHLQSLQRRRDELNALQLKSLRFVGDGTDLTVALPAGHTWCTAQLTTQSGRSFVANLPTEEVFTLPHRDSAEGYVRLARPVNYGGAVIDGIELEFSQGRVVKATAKNNEPLLQELLATDDGASRLGEVALVVHETSLARSGRRFHHPLLDENASNHIALGEAYGFCLRTPDQAALNRSLIHVDLPLNARVEPS